MPGIAGIISGGSSEKNALALKQMVKCMLHEPSYNSGSYINKQLGLYAGWVCHTGSFADCMPIWNETHDVCMIYSGENFNDRYDIDNIREHGHQFNPETASYLVHIYEEFGSRFFEKLNGWFSGIIIDLRDDEIILFNDRYGLGRIYYRQSAEGFHFSSEAKSLLKVFPELRQLDFSSLAETFSFGCVLQNRTMFSKIKLFPGGSRWTFKATNSVKKERYFNPETWENQKMLGGPEYYEKLKDIFARILPRYFCGRNRVGMSLTGGLDGRMIMSWANRPPEDISCYTFGSLYRDCNDVKIARQVAKICGYTHKTIDVGPQFFPMFPSLAEKAVYISDGTMNVTGSVELYVNMIASQIAPIRLTGNYGSEIMRGSVAFGPGYLNESLFKPEFPQLVRTAAKIYAREYQSHKISFIVFKQVPWYHYSRLSVEQSQLSLRSPYLDNDLVSLIYQAPKDLLLSKETSFRLIADGNAALARIPTDRGVRYGPIPFITKLQHLCQEFTFKAEYAYDYGMPQWVASIDHQLASLHLEKLFLGRHKFYHFRVWYRDQFASYIKDILLDRRTLARPYLAGQNLEKMVNSHIRGYRNYTSDIHRILTAELIQRRLIESP